MSIKQDTQVVLSFLKELPENTIIQHIKSVTVNTDQNNSKVTRVFRAIKPLQVQYAQVHNQLKAKLDQLGEDVIQDIKDEIQILFQTLTPKYFKGDKFQKVTEIEKITFGEDDTITQEELQFQVENGTVYLVDIWATWSPDCQEPMEHFQKMLKKHVEWAGKVKIVGISVDEDTNLVVERVNAKNWKLLEHYRFLKGYDRENQFFEYIQLVEIQIPFVILIDKWGVIDYLGNPSQRNFEARINELIAATDKGNKPYEQQQNTNEQGFELLTKDQYKESKQFAENLQNALIQAEFQGIVEVVLEKVNYWKQDGSKQVHKRSKLSLSYNVDVKEEPKINAFLENHWNKIPENLRQVKKSKIRDPQRYIKEIKVKFQEIFAAYNVEISYNQIEEISVRFNIKQGSDNVFKTEYLTLTVKNINLDIYINAQEKVREYLKQFEEEYDLEINDIIERITTQLRCSITLKPGSQFQSIENYKKWGEKEYFTIEHVPEQVLLLFYWTNWCNICVKFIKENMELLQKNSNKWGKSVRFVSLSLVQAEDAKEFMDYHSESLKYIDFYFPKEQCQRDAILYDAQSVPHYVVVDKFGIVRQITSYVEEELVEQLINEQTQETPFNIGHEVEVNEEVFGKVLGILKQAKTSENFVEVDKANILQFEIFFSTTVQVDGQFKNNKPTIDIFCRETQLDVVNQVLTVIFSVIPENNWEISKSVSKTFSVSYPGTVCVVCQNDITNEVQQYYSPFKKEHVCVECAEFDDKEKQGLERYKYQDTLIFINGPLTDLSVLEDIDDHKIGKNLKLKEGEGSQLHSMMCNGCREGSEGPRYIAANAMPGQYRQEGYIDYCQACFLILKDKKSEKAQEIIKQNEADGMTGDSLLVRILFNLGEYLEF